MELSAKHQEILAVYAETKSMTQTAKRVGRSYRLVNKILHRSGVSINPPHLTLKPARFSTEQRTEIVALYAQGVGTTTIGKKFGCFSRTICEALKTEGVSLRPRHQLTENQKSTALRLYSQRLTLRDIAKQIGCSIWSVDDLLKRSGCERRKPGFMQRAFSPEQETEIIDRYREGWNIVELGDMFDSSPSVIWSAMQRRGEVCRPQSVSQRHYALRTDFFRAIDTEEKAYWFGFITADGALTTTSSTGKNVSYLRVYLQRQDRGHLEKFQAALETTLPIFDFMQRPNKTTKEPKPTSGITISSKDIVDDLVRHGLTQNKSLTVGWWDGPPELMRHYARGVFDGDGSVVKGKGRWGSPVRWGMSLVGSIPLINGYVKWTAPHLSHPMRSELTKSGRNAYARTQGIHRAGVLAELLYAGSTIFLDRKKRRADDLMAFASTRTEPCRNPSWASGQQR